MRPPPSRSSRSNAPALQATSAAPRAWVVLTENSGATVPATAPGETATPTPSAGRPSPPALAGLPRRPSGHRHANGDSRAGNARVRAPVPASPQSDSPRLSDSANALPPQTAGSPWVLLTRHAGENVPELPTHAHEPAQETPSPAPTADIEPPRHDATPQTPERALLARHNTNSESRDWRQPTPAPVPAHSVVIDIPPESPRETIAAALHAMSFVAEHGPPTPDRPQRLALQRDMETEYIGWAASVLSARQAAFGEGRYSVHEDMRAPLKEAVLPALYEGISGFVSSASRSPVRNAIAAAVGPRTDASGKQVGDLAFQLDAASISGAVGGVTAYAVDAWVLQAMSRRKKLSNFPELKAVALKALIPDPSPVQLRIVNGAKEYWRPSAGLSEGPTMQALRNQAADLRDAIEKQQQRLDGKGIFTWSQPAVTGAFNVARRAASNANWLIKPFPVFVGSILASSSAGALTKFGFGMAKGVPGLAQTTIDNLVGGKQQANVYVVKPPHADTRAAGWSDIGGLSRFMGASAREAKDLFLQSFNPARPWHKAREQALHVLVTAIANAGASVASVGFGSLFGSIERHGSLSALPGEPLNSRAYLVQQFAQSATNDFYWNGGKEMQKSDAHALGTELDRYRDGKQDALLRAVHRTQATLPELLDGVREASSHAENAGHIAAVLATLDEVGAFVGAEQRVASDRFERARRCLEAALPAAANRGPAENAAHRKLLEGLDTAIRLSSQYEELVRMRQPVSAASSSDAVPSREA